MEEKDSIVVTCDVLSWLSVGGGDWGVYVQVRGAAGTIAVNAVLCSSADALWERYAALSGCSFTMRPDSFFTYFSANSMTQLNAVIQLNSGTDILGMSVCVCGRDKAPV